MAAPAPAAGFRSVDPSVSRTPLPLEGRDLPTVCVLCSHNCGLVVDVEAGRITDVRADENNAITEGYVCNKAFSIPHYVDHAQRLEHPLRRKPDGSFERISWETAISEIAGKLAALRDAHGPRAIGLIGIGGQGNHMDGPFGLSFLGALGSKRWFNALAQEKTQHFLNNQWMFDSPPSVWFQADIEHTKYLLVMGTNPRISNRDRKANDTFKELNDDPSVSVVVVDPRETETTRGADAHLRTKPGSDAYLLLGIAATIASGEGLADAKFIAEHTNGFEALRKALEAVDVEEMARRCGLETAELVRTAHDFANADSAAIMQDLAVEHLPYSTLISYLVRAISALTGNVGTAGGGIFMETVTPPQWNPKRFEEPERALASGIPSIAAMGGFPMFSPSLVPEEIMVDHPERMRAVIVEGANPFLSFSDTSRWREAREQLDLLVAIEPTYTETTAQADYVLPTPVGYEKWETSIFPKGYPEVMAQVRPPVVPGPEEALPEPEIYARLIEAMELLPPIPEELHALAETALEPGGGAAYMGAMQAAAGGDQAALLFWGYRTLGLHLPSPALVAIWAQCHESAFMRRDSVLRTLGGEWGDKNPFEIAAELFRRVLDNPQGTELARCDVETNFEDHIGWDDKRVRLAPEPMLAEIARAAENDLPTDPDYPLVLAAGLRTRWTANTIQRNPAWRKGRGPHCPLHLSAQDAKALGLAKGDRARLVTRRGAVELPVEIDPKVQAGHVWVANGFGASYPNPETGVLEVQGVNLNELTDVNDRDPLTGCPYHKYTLCRVERA